MSASTTILHRAWADERREGTGPKGGTVGSQTNAPLLLLLQLAFPLGRKLAYACCELPDLLPQVFQLVVYVVPALRLAPRRAPCFAEDEGQRDGEEEPLRQGVGTVLDRSVPRNGRREGGGEGRTRFGFGLFGGTVGEATAHRVSDKGRMCFAGSPSMPVRSLTSVRYILCARSTQNPRKRSCLPGPRDQRPGLNNARGGEADCFAWFFSWALMGLAIVFSHKHKHKGT